MPNYFTLTRKTALDAGPVDLNTIDEELCQHFSVPVDPTRWYGGWYNSIGFGLALGWSWDKMRDIFEKQNTLDILNYLEEHFVANAWYQPR